MIYSVTFALLAALATASPLHKRLTNQVIVSYRTGTCLTLPAGTAPANGVLLTVGPCATATRWDISPGSGSVLVTGTNFALDAGVNPSNNVPAKIWTSYPGVTQQTWYYTADNRIAITGGTQCLDEGPSGPQTYQCTTGNTNQIWTVQSGPPPPSSTSTTTTSTSTTSTSTTSTSSSVPTGAKQLKWRASASSPYVCATVQSPATPGSGSLVNMGACNSPSSANNAGGQLFTFMGNGLIQYAGTNFCLDAGTNPSNGVQMKLWQCFAGLSQQTWTFGTSGLVRTANSECLDVDNSNNVKLQTWTCSAPDPQQQFLIQ